MVRRARLEKKPRDGMDGDRRASGRSATRARSIGRRASTSSALSDVGDADVGTEGRDRRRDGRCGDGDDGGDARKKIVSMSSSSSDDRSVVASSSREADGDDVDDMMVVAPDRSRLDRSRGRGGRARDSVGRHGGTRCARRARIASRRRRRRQRRRRRRRASFVPARAGRTGGRGIHPSLSREPSWCGVGGCTKGWERAGREATGRWML